ncbi:MAG: FAD-dependent oxidoreductase [Chloroflexi bacterium]|nr:FAD-dependent oxidoreductase [Chloroflexota bacterium]MCL5026939.1 FAD-dependent oxidoreductase [Chloroflexota bacterium]
MAETIRWNNEVPVVRQTDVLVVGGGMAGIGAAVAAARNGANTTLIEQYGALGGTGSTGLVGPFMTSFDEKGTVQIVRGVFDELVRRMAKTGGAVHPSQVPPGTPYSSFTVYAHGNVTPYDPEALKLVADEMIEEAGIHLMYHTFMADVLKEGDGVRGVIVVNKSGMQAIRAKVVVDCTGDGDVAYLAGVPMAKGRPSDGKMQPMSMFFRVGGIDDAALVEYRRQHPTERNLFATPIAEAKAKGDPLNVPRDNLGLYQTMRPGEYRANASRLLGYDSTDVDSLTQAEIEGRKQVQELMRFFHKYCPGMQNAYLVDTGAHVGVRESRRIVGEYVLRVEDVVEATEFPDVIAMNGFFIDIHNPEGVGKAEPPGVRAANAYEIPYRSLVPLKVDQLLAAGRCLSADHVAFGAVRVMPPACATGEAAGTAAALAVKHGVTPRRVPVDELQQTLLAQGAYLGARFATPQAPEPPVPGR